MEHTKLKPRHLGKKNSGVALVLVLMLVVLTTIMMLAFFLSVQTESKSMRSVVSGQNSRQLADLAVQSVIAQVQQATTQGPKVAWASQPGMIRTYDNTGAALGWYKLYSSTTNFISSPSESLTTIQQDVPTQSWATPGSPNYGVYTDVNSPVISSDGKLTYPIVNPASAVSIATANASPSNPATNNEVLGFDIATASTPGYSAGGGPAGSNASANNNPAAMPVLWLYVLQNGAIATPLNGGNGTVTFNTTGPVPTAANPIVGRVAYWTDDETSKLNVNTAADGTYYDTPRFQNSDPLSTAALGAKTTSGSTASQSSPTQRDIYRILDKQLAVTPPFGTEFQRYIGHPAQTRLSYAIPAITSMDLVSRSQLLTELTPFLQWGGSQGGVQTEYEFLQSGSTTAGNYGFTPPLRQTPYATLDEWMFSTALGTPNRVPSPGTLLTANPAPLLTNTRLQQLRFFLSANSDAPEVNLFGQPRISMWPISTADLTVGNPNTGGFTTAFDQLIAKSASLAPSSTTASNYYFSRLRNAATTGASSPFQDWNNSTTSSTFNLNAASATRNQSIFVYLRTLAKTAIPGYGTSFTGKYGAPEMDQILTEIFDYCRSTNPSDDLLSFGNTYDQRRLDTATTTGGMSTYDGIGQVTPIELNLGNSYLTKGFGRFCSISDIAIDFTQSQANTYTSTGATDPTHITVTGVIYLGLYSPSLGPGDLTPDMRVEILPAGLNAMTVSDGTSTFPVFNGPSNSASATNLAKTTYSSIPIVAGFDNSQSQNEWHDQNGNYQMFQWGGAIGPRQLFAFKNATYTSSTGGSSPTPAAPNQSNYMFCGEPLKLLKTGTLTFSAPTQLEIRIYNNRGQAQANSSTGDGSPGNPSTEMVQDMFVTFPPFTSSMPTYVQDLYNPSGSVTSGLTKGVGNADYSNIYPITSGDIVQSLVAGYNGDMRLIAGQQIIKVSDVTATGAAFVKHPSFNSTAMAHCLRDGFPVLTGSIGPYFQAPGFASAGQLVSAATYGYPTINGLVSHAAGSNPPDTSGDWDNGVGAIFDGPYINKADESASQFVNFGASVATEPPYFSGQEGGTQTVYATPNRTVASPVMFGSLPTGVPLTTPAGTAYTTTPATPVPWQTLLFRPQAGHFGENAPEDELLLDWFWMPVVEPYSISTTLATAGKVNMNCQIAPFTYMTRYTALMGVLGSEYVIAVPTSAGPTYKSFNAPATSYRTPVKVLESDNVTPADTDGTLRPFKDRFASGKIFKSAAEICDIYLVPQGQSWTNWALAGSPSSTSDAETFWSNNKLSGDNTRERPYNGLYSRLTTKSNTYTVHVRAQTLTMPSNGTPGQWVENPQLITSEYRGSVTINRYLDPQDPNIPDFAASSNLLKYSIDSYYKYRVLETRRFLP